MVCLLHFPRTRPSRAHARKRQSLPPPSLPRLLTMSSPSPHAAVAAAAGIVYCAPTGSATGGKARNKKAPVEEEKKPTIPAPYGNGEIVELSTTTRLTSFDLASFLLFQTAAYPSCRPEKGATWMINRADTVPLPTATATLAALLEPAPSFARRVLLAKYFADMNRRVHVCGNAALGVGCASAQAQCMVTKKHPLYPGFCTNCTKDNVKVTLDSAALIYEVSRTTGNAPDAAALYTELYLRESARFRWHQAAGARQWAIHCARPVLAMLIAKAPPTYCASLCAAHEAWCMTNPRVTGMIVWPEHDFVTSLRVAPKECATSAPTCKGHAHTGQCTTPARASKAAVAPKKTPVSASHKKKRACVTQPQPPAAPSGPVHAAKKARKRDDTDSDTGDDPSDDASDDEDALIAIKHVSPVMDDCIGKAYFSADADSQLAAALALLKADGCM